MMMGISNRLNKLRGVFFGGRRGSASPDNNSGGSGGREHGFTLIEVLIALSLTAILMAGVYSLYNTFYKRSACQDDMLGAQQNARAALQLMQKEIILAGHRVPTTTGGPLPVEAGANAASVTFRYMEALKDLNDPDRAAIRYLITYSASGDSLMRRQCETDPADSANWELCLDSTGDSYAIISGLDTSDATGGLEFKYYGADGAEVIGPINDEATLRDLRYIEIFIKTTVDTICGTKTVEAKTRVNLRNLSVDAAEPDPTPPNTPTGLQVREVTNGARVGGTCGELNVRWNAPATNVDTDINYYSISYTEDGGGSGNMRVFVRDLIDDDTTNGILDESDSKYYYTLAPGTNPADNLLYLKHYSSDGGTTDNNKYTIKIVAVDLDGNVSDVTSVATTNTTYETATNSDFGVDVDDTVINPAKPFPVSITSALPDEATNNITITWDNPAENTDVIGFNIYRSTAPFPDIDVDAVNPLATMNAPITAVGTVELVASPYGGEGQKAVGAGSTSFTDSALIGCQTYYYAIIPKTCDATLIDKRTDAPADTDSSRQWAVATDYAVVYGDGIGDAVINITDYPDFNLSNTTPGDTELPPNPQIDYAAGWKRIFLTITNPSLEEAPDFAHSVVYVQSGAECPSIDELTGQVDTDSVLLPNSNTDAFGGIDFEPGIFTGHDTVSPAYTTHAVMCDSLSNAECITPAVNPSPLSPALLNDTQYCYLGISYDTCGNANSTIGVVTTQATMCGDEPGGAPGNGGSLDLSIWPDVDTDISVSGCSSKFNVSFGGMNHVFDQGYYDIASYTIHAKSGNASFGTPEDSTAVDMVNASLTAAGFIHTSNDFSVHTNGLPYIEGELYSFGVSGLDCIYRNIEPDNVDYVYATIKANNYSGWLSISDISPGSID
ncbi:MAG: prepilin-type N-terminal cleavage/methylation domain-containing protein, partial [Deltaproteobacteria bacterium]|nr:prepilin-type N-terminal cleavage/methylation domain-containing protein [Deltaproteobacteria bacterium]